MHFITGGAYNGKRKWIRKNYPEETQWISAYEKGSLQLPNVHHGTILVFEGVEEWVRQAITPGLSSDEVLHHIMTRIESLIDWENEQQDHQLVLAGTDITKGIVPIEKVDRIQRDVTGWVYQRIVEQAARVDVIWYGIATRLK